jgi:hypothetical protein
VVIFRRSVVKRHIHIMICIYGLVTLYLYAVTITFITYCRIVYLNHIFHCNLCNEEIKK